MSESATEKSTGFFVPFARQGNAEVCYINVWRVLGIRGTERDRCTIDVQNGTGMTPYNVQVGAHVAAAMIDLAMCRTRDGFVLKLLAMDPEVLSEWEQRLRDKVTGELKPYLDATVVEHLERLAQGDDGRPRKPGKKKSGDATTAEQGKR